MGSNINHTKTKRNLEHQAESEAASEAWIGLASGKGRLTGDALAQAAADFLLQKLNAAPAADRDQLAAAILNVHRPEAKPAFEYAAVGVLLQME